MDLRNDPDDLLIRYAKDFRIRNELRLRFLLSGSAQALFRFSPFRVPSVGRRLAIAPYREASREVTPRGGPAQQATKPLNHVRSQKFSPFFAPSQRIRVPIFGFHGRVKTVEETLSAQRLALFSFL